MPKVQPPDFLVRRRYSESLIDQKITFNGTTVRRVADGIKMPASTFYVKKGEPETFSIEQVRSLAKVLGWTDLEMLSFVKGQEVRERDMAQ